jgi:hypothetical protein
MFFLILFILDFIPFKLDIFHSLYFNYIVVKMQVIYPWYPVHLCYRI